MRCGHLALPEKADLLSAEKKKAARMAPSFNSVLGPYLPVVLPHSLLSTTLPDTQSWAAEETLFPFRLCNNPAFAL